MIRVSVVFIFFISIICTIPVSAQMRGFGMGGPKPDPKLAGKKIVNKITLYNSSKYDDKKSGQLVAHEKLKKEIVEAIKFDIMSSYSKECPVQASIDSQDYTTLISTLIKNEEGPSTWDDGVLEYQLALAISVSYNAKILCIISNDAKLLTVVKKSQRRADDALATINRLQSDPYNKSNQGEYDSAINIIRATNYFKEGILAGVLKDTETALNAYEDALKLYPGFSEAYYQRATLYQGISKKEEAVNDYSQAIKYDKNDASYYIARGICYFNMGQKDKAMNDLNHVLGMNPSDTLLFTAYAARGNIYEMNGEDRKALQDYTKAIELNPKAAEVFFRKGFLNRRLENYEEAVKDFDQVIRLEKNNPDAYFERGSTYAYLNDKQKVLDDYKIAAKLGSNEAKKVLNKYNIEWE